MSARPQQSSLFPESEPRPSESTLWGHLHLPHLALDAALGQLRAAGGNIEAPLALVEGPEARRRIFDCNAAARRGGLRPGQALAAARALLPQVQVLERDPTLEQASLEHLAALAYRFSGRVALVPPSGLALELGGSLRLFGGLTGMHRQLLATLARSGLRLRLGLAYGPSAAALLARAGIDTPATRPARLRALAGGLPIALSGLDGDACRLLTGVGIHRLDGLFALPRDGLARRLGSAALLHLDRLLGQAEEVLSIWQPPARFEERLELSSEINRSSALLGPMRQLLEQLGQFLRGADLGLQDFALELEHEGRPPTRIEVGTATPERDPERLLALADTRLAQLRLPGPVRALRLLAGSLSRFQPRARSLLADNHAAAEPMDLLLDRLRARLGDDAIGHLDSHPDHRPERAGRTQPTAPGKPGPGRAGRPLWLLPAPRPIDPQGLTLLTGPERIESGWWDEGDQRRDYYLALDRDESRCWVFREARAPHRWFLHGLFG